MEEKTMSESRDMLNAAFELAEEIKKYTGWCYTDAMAVGIIEKALTRAFRPKDWPEFTPFPWEQSDTLRLLRYCVQDSETPPDPVEKAWVEQHCKSQEQHKV
jgi:hypothetical protein